MSEFTFTLILPEISDFDDELVDKLHEYGCNDSTIIRRGKGEVYAVFTREAISYEEAVSSAIEGIKKAGFKSILHQI